MMDRSLGRNSPGFEILQHTAIKHFEWKMFFTR